MIAQTHNYLPGNITGKTSVSHKADQFCLTDKSLDLFFREVRRMIDRSSRGDMDGQEYVRYLGSWRIAVKHHYEVHSEQGGDCYCGVYETYPVVDRDQIEVVEAYDERHDQNLPGVVCRLNEFYKTKQY